jgi:hypothetical protein
MVGTINRQEQMRERMERIASEIEDIGNTLEKVFTEDRDFSEIEGYIKIMVFRYGSQRKRCATFNVDTTPYDERVKRSLTGISQKGLIKLEAYQFTN